MDRGWPDLPRPPDGTEVRFHLTYDPYDADRDPGRAIGTGTSGG